MISESPSRSWISWKTRGKFCITRTRGSMMVSWFTPFLNLDKLLNGIGALVLSHKTEIITALPSQGCCKVLMQLCKESIWHGVNEGAIPSFLAFILLGDRSQRTQVDEMRELVTGIPAPLISSVLCSTDWGNFWRSSFRSSHTKD